MRQFTESIELPRKNTSAAPFSKGNGLHSEGAAQLLRVTIIGTRLECMRIWYSLLFAIKLGTVPAALSAVLVFLASDETAPEVSSRGRHSNTPRIR